MPTPGEILFFSLIQSFVAGGRSRTKEGTLYYSAEVRAKVQTQECQLQVGRWEGRREREDTSICHQGPPVPAGPSQ